MDLTLLWKTVLADDLRQFRELGFVAVRWFILGDGLTYGTPKDGHPPRLEGNQWRFTPPPSLDGGQIVEDFRLMLEVFRQANPPGSRPLKLLRNDVDPEIGTVDCDRLAGAVDDPTATRRNDDQLDPVALGE